MAEASTCPTCNTKLGGILSSHKIYSASKSEIVNQIIGGGDGIYCTKCGPDYVAKARGIVHDEKAKITTDLASIIQSIPVVTIHAPPKWDFEIKGIVTGQSTTGTGIISEFFSSFTDLVGAQSNAYNEKLVNGENLCLYQLRSKAFALGGNAVVGTDIDYSEVGGGKGMLMVCMAGTAVRLENVDALFPDLGTNLKRHSEISKKVELFGRFEAENYY